MKILASSPEYAGTAIAASDASDPRSSKVRKGSPQSYRELFDLTDIDYIQRVMSDLFTGADKMPTRVLRGFRQSHDRPSVHNPTARLIFVRQARTYPVCSRG